MWIRHERLPTGTRPSRAAPLLRPLHLIREITKIHFEMGGGGGASPGMLNKFGDMKKIPLLFIACLPRCQRQIRSRQSRASAHCGARNHVRNTGYKKKRLQRSHGAIYTICAKPTTRHVSGGRRSAVARREKDRSLGAGGDCEQGRRGQRPCTYKQIKETKRN